MNLYAIARQAFRALTRNWLQSVLSILGIAVGVAAFISVVAIGNAATTAVENQLKSLGDNFIWIEAGSRTRNGLRAGARGTRSLVEADAQAIMEQVPMIKTITPNVDGHFQVVYGNENWATQYRGVTPDYLKIRRWEIQEGSFFSQLDVEQDNAVCVLGQTVVTNLFPGADPVGAVINVAGVPCRVLGVLRGKGFSTTGQDQDDFVLMPYTTVQKRITGTFWLDDIFCSAVTSESMPEATKLIANLLRERHHLNPGEDDDFNVRRPEDLVKAQLSSREVMSLLLASIASLSLIVGGIGIMNIMLVSVTQRTREIGVRLAIGARERDVQLQFLSEAVFIAALGAGLGAILGFFACGMVPDLFGFPTALNTEMFVIGAVFAASTGIIFGFYPARKASRLDPIEALRFE